MAHNCSASDLYCMYSVLVLDIGRFSVHFACLNVKRFKRCYMVCFSSALLYLLVITHCYVIVLYNRRYVKNIRANFQEWMTNSLNSDAKVREDLLSKKY